MACHRPGWAVAIGRNGSAWGDGLHPPSTEAPRKQEGDGRSPAGVFGIGTAFGYTARVDSKMPYQQMQADDWCMDVPASPLYNQIVSAAKVGKAAVQGSSEAMRLDLHHDGDPRYRQGFVIEHNAAAVPGRGSCIFGHLWRKPGKPPPVARRWTRPTCSACWRGCSRRASLGSSCYRRPSTDACGPPGSCRSAERRHERAFGR